MSGEDEALAAAQKLAASIDWTALERALGVAVTDSVREFATAEAADVAGYGSGMARHMVAAIRRGDAAMKAEVLDQERALRELARIRLNEFEEHALGVVFAAILRVGSAAVRSAVAL